VTAIACLKQGCRIKGEEIIEHCRKQLASFQLPKKVIFAEKLPRIAATDRPPELFRIYNGRQANNKRHQDT
jgi:hypothetical protein